MSVRKRRDFLRSVFASDIAAIRQMAKKLSAEIRVIFANVGRLNVAKKNAGKSERPATAAKSRAATFCGVAKKCRAIAASGSAAKKTT